MYRFDALKPFVKAALERRRRKRKGRKLPRPARPLHPRAIQNFYFSELQFILKELEDILKKIIVPSLGGILKEAEALRPKKDHRVDSYDETIKTIIKKSKIQFYSVVSPQRVKTIAQKVAERTNDFNSKDVNRVFKSVIGVDVFHHEPWIEQEMKSFTTQNVSYINSIPEQFFERVEHTVMRGARSGKLTTDIAKELEKDHDITSRKAALIARDQVSKFNSNLTQLRHKQVGVEKYIWSTSLDERVREEHAEFEGETFSWDDPPDDEGNPGEPINCVPEDALISLHAETMKAYRRWYDGKLTKIVTDSGESLRITPNHPVLTRRGWLPANLLKVGDYLVQAPPQSLNRFIANPKSRNTTAQEMFRSFKSLGIRHGIRASGPSFHGDAKNEQIDIVKVDRALFFDRITSRSKKFRKDRFSWPSEFALGQSHISFYKIAFRFASDCIVSSFRKISSFLRGRFFHSQKHRFASPSDFYVMTQEDSSNGSSTQFEALSDSLLAHAVSVEPNNFTFRKIESIVSESFSGWVHNFETITGWFSCVNLVVHNCRCVAMPVFEDGNEQDEEDDEE